MYPGYSLQVEEYRHPHEFPVRMTYLAIAVVGIIVLLLLNWVIALSIIFGLGVVFLTWYLSLRSSVANHVRVSPTQFPEIYQLAAEAARRLDIPMPEVYVEQNPMINAYATGFSRKNYQVVLTTGIIQAMSPKELQFVISHEFGHIKSVHTVYRVVTSQLLSGNPLLFLFSWIQTVFRFALLFMSRVNEYTADRAGMIGCGSVYASIAAMTKLAVGKEMFEQMNIKEYFRQIEEFKNNKLGIFTELEADHPFIVNRIRAMAHFYKSAEYQMIKNKLGEGGTSILQEPVMGTMHLLDKIVDKYHPHQQVAPNAYLYQGNIQPQATIQSPPQPHTPVGVQPVSQPVVQPQQIPSVQNPVVICPNCQQQNRTDSFYCFACGTKLK